MGEKAVTGKKRTVKPFIVPKGESPLARLNKYIELSPSGKATDFDSVIRGFKSRQLSHKVKPPFSHKGCSLTEFVSVRVFVPFCSKKRRLMLNPESIEALNRFRLLNYQSD